MKYTLESRGALWRVVLENRALVALYTVAGIVCAFLGSYAASYLQRVLDAFQTGTLHIGILLGYGGILLTQCVIEYLDNVPHARLPNRIALGLKLLALKKMAVIDYRQQQAFGTGTLVQRIESGADGGKRVVFNYYLRLIRELIPEILFSLLFIAQLDARILRYVALSYLVVLVVSKWLLGYLYRIKERILDNEEAFSHTLVRGLMELAVFRVNKRYAREIRRAEDAAETITKARVQIQLVHEAFFALFYVLVIIIKVALLWVGWQSGSLTVGAAAALLALLDRAYQPIAIANVMYVQFRLDRAAFARLDAFLRLPEDARLVQGAPLLTGPSAVRFEDVTVCYEGRTVLEGFSLDVASGKTIALVGESGSGKSTAAKLMAGLIRPDAGRVWVDGQDLSTLSLNAYYDYLAYVSQEAPVFEGTLRENLVFDADIEDARLEEALRAMALGPLLDALPQGLHTPIGERGALLSGGERQRLALARLLCQDPRLVILDEAFSALDEHNEKLVMERLHPFLQTRTVLMITHKLNTLRDVDEILFLQSGRIVEQGGFEDLLARGGAFARLWHAQERKRAEGGMD